MAQNVQEIWQTDFTGGVVDSVPADQLEDNQCASILNLLPMRDGKNLSVRGGIAPYTASVGTKVLGAMSKKLTTGTETIVYAIGTGTAGSRQLDIVVASQVGSDYVATTVNCAALTSPTDGRYYADKLDGVWFCGWDDNRIFLSDNLTGLYTLDIVPTNIASSVVTKVKNKNHGTGSSDTDAPAGHSLVQHRGRLWICQGETVHFCGTDDGHAYKRWEDWLPWDDPSVATETIIDDGNSMKISPYGTKVIGLSSTFDGLLVFKENTISLWTYPDSAAPWEVSEGANIEVISKEVGAIGQNSIVRVGNTIYFLGYDSGESLSLFSLSGNSVSDLGLGVPNRMRILKQFPNIWMAPLGDYLYITSDEGMYLAYSLLNGAFYDLSSEKVYAPVSVGDKLWMVNHNGKVSRYPYGSLDDTVPVSYSIETRQWKPKGWYGEFKGRMLFVEFGSVDAGNIGYYLKWDSSRPTLNDGTFGSVGSNVPKYNDGVLYNSGEVFGGSRGLATMKKAEITGRGRSLAFGFRGTATSDTYINRLGLGYRGRTGKT